MAGRRTLSVVLSVAVAVGATLASAGAAGAGTPPSLSMSAVHESITVNQAPQFKYTTDHLSSSANLVLQRQFGTAHVWQAVKDHIPHGTNKIVTAPTLTQLGHYVYRMAAFRDHKTVAVTKYTHSIYAYGSVSIGVICASSQYYDGDCDSGTEQVGGTLFSYHMFLSADYYPDYYQALQFGRTSCRSMSLQFADYYPDDETSYVKIVQSATDPQYAQSNPGQIGTFDATLDGGPFYLDVADGDADGIYFAGNASCYTVSGRR